MAHATTLPASSCRRANAVFGAARRELTDLGLTTELRLTKSGADRIYAIEWEEGDDSWRDVREAADAPRCTWLGHSRRTQDDGGPYLRYIHRIAFSV